MINEQYVSFEIAKLLKKKGFNCGCISYYEHFSSEITLYSGMVPEWSDSYIDHNKADGRYSRPTQQMAMQWLREVHHIHVCPEYKAFFQERPRKIYHHWCNKIVGIDRYFKQGINDWDTLNPDYFYFNHCKTYHDSYESACMECIDYALRNLLEEDKDE